MSANTRVARFLLAAASLLVGTGVARAQFFPDLIISEIEISPFSPAPGQDITVTVHALNVGNAIPAAETFMYLYHDTPSPIECEFDQVQALGIAFPPETERLFTFTVNYPAAGSVELWAWVDACENLIDEGGLAGETNNALSRTINVGIGDLSIDSITPTVADPVPGQPIFVDVIVRNNGPAIVEEVWWLGVVRQAAEPFACGQLQSQGPFLNFPANSTQTVQFGPYTYAEGGAHPIWAWVDCQNNVQESNEANNKEFSRITVNQPDLVVESVVTSVATPNINQAFDVTVTVTNVGSGPCEGYRISIAPDSITLPEDGCALTDFIDDPNGLEVEESFTTVFQVTYTESRQHRLWAIVDSCGDAVAEAREDNNASSIDLNVGNPAGGAPDLVVESIDVTEIPTPEYGAVTVFDVTVRNIGPAPAGAFRIGDFDLPDFPGPFPSAVVIGSPGPSNGGPSLSTGGADWNNCAWRSRDVPNGLAAGASITVQFWRGYWAGGPYTFTAYADACGSQSYQSVSESSETNNRFTVEFEVIGCDADSDRDGFCDDEDLCPNVADELNNDSDGDGEGDACDTDDDNDGVLDVDDCEPRNPAIYPGATDCPDGLDNDCDGQVDEDAATWYRDADGDGFGDANDTTVDCFARAGYVADGTDCDDMRANVYPGANGPCDDGLDNDCDGTVDNEQPVWGRDVDADGFTDPNDQIIDADGVCDGQPAGYILASARPDPNDNDFMNPEPVRIDPEEINIATPHGIVNTATLTLTRNGPEPYTYDIAVAYGATASDWLDLDAPTGTAVDGVADILLTPIVADLELAAYTATMTVTVNGSIPFPVVPVNLLVRNPILRVVHTGDALAGGDLDWDYYDNAAGMSSVRVDFSVQPGQVYETETPYGEGVYLYEDNTDDCAVFQGFRDEDGNMLDFHPRPDEFKVGPIVMDRDRTIDAEYAPDFLACSTCAVTMMMFCCIGLRLTHPTRGTRRPRPSEKD